MVRGRNARPFDTGSYVCLCWDGGGVCRHSMFAGRCMHVHTNMHNLSSSVLECGIVVCVRVHWFQHLDLVFVLTQG